ncbi:MAG: hypothetical protein QM537_01770 [Candidatus Symbiobacter sp.]|nr:hypothetical protein [Candidatus Symbiobacter sp.]
MDASPHQHEKSNNIVAWGRQVWVRPEAVGLIIFTRASLDKFWRVA